MSATGPSAPTSSQAGAPEANQVVALIASVPDNLAAPPDFATSFSPHQYEYPDAEDLDWDKRAKNFRAQNLAFSMRHWLGTAYKINPQAPKMRLGSKMGKG
jgi:hypothetical protein